MNKKGGENEYEQEKRKIFKKVNFRLEYKVPEGKYFFLGDNRANSNDSRYWENPYIDSKYIKGKAFIKINPLDLRNDYIK